MFIMCKNKQEEAKKYIHLFLKEAYSYMHMYYYLITTHLFELYQIMYVVKALT